MAARDFINFVFLIPAYVFLSIISYLALHYVFHQEVLALVLLLIAIAIVGVDLLKQTITSLIHRNFALDYIAILAISVGLFTSQFLVSAIITLMLSGGNALEKYAMARAKKSLTALTDRIPNQVVVLLDDGSESAVAVESVKASTRILVRKGEVIPLDGVLESAVTQTDESSLTGEPFIIDKFKGDQLRSGTINKGNPIQLKVSKEDSESTYRKIIDMVKKAQEEKTPMIRLANKFSTIFTLITLSIVAVTYLLTHNLSRVLAILVIATPCPLILATPIALIGGMNSAARKRIIVKNLSSIEVLSRVDTLIFDKTGTITLGKPIVEEVVIVNKKFDEAKVYGIAEAIERNSLHPLAKAIVHAARFHGSEKLKATKIEEKIGSGISGVVSGKTYVLSKPKGSFQNQIHLSCNGKLIAKFMLADEIKRDTSLTIRKLEKSGLEMHIFTGDKREATEKVMKQLGIDIHVRTDCSPEDKKTGVKELKSAGKITAMIGDGINDAPALAIADVGMVFSHEEHTAASEAADMVFLGGDLDSVIESMNISKKTISIALQSILFGIGLSIAGMILASFGLIIPIIGAFLQEAIDVAVIINALRTSRA
ncbi:MAG: cadmium-translocating P-type ATPase [Nanoarchaeota archaeon]|nr:MAG: cadmium-translocating P-type ATPase [Nanoarchaeota archaeon]